MIFFKVQKNKYNKGFSLVEMLVAIGIFMSIMTIAISSLISIMGSTKKAQAIKSTIDSVTFAIENISRDMRVGTDYDCSPSVPSSRDCTTGGREIQYVNSNGQSITYQFSTSTTSTGAPLSKLVKVAGSPCSTNCSVDLISEDADVYIDNMTFYVIGSDNESNSDMTQKTQPRVIITVSGSVSVKGSANTSFNLQTNISQRARR